MDAASSTRSELRFLACGSVDDGKSTLIGRLINDATGLFEDQIATLQEDQPALRHGRRAASTSPCCSTGWRPSASRASPSTSPIASSRPAKRAFVVADTPGHQQFTRNMATGASNADLAVLLVDARKGLFEQTRRHAAIVSLLGIRARRAGGQQDRPGRFLRSAGSARSRRAFATFSQSLGFALDHIDPGVGPRRRQCRAPQQAHAVVRRPGAAVAHLETVDVGEARRRARRCASPCNGSTGRTPRSAASPAPWSRASVSGRRSRHGRRLGAAARRSSASSASTATSPRRGRPGARHADLADEIDIARGELLVDPRRRPIVTRRFSADSWDARGAGAAAPVLPAQDRHGDGAGAR